MPIVGPPHLDALGMRHGKEKETRIPEVPQMLIFFLLILEYALWAL